jgi:hypothetical protein
VHQCTLKSGSATLNLMLGSLVHQAHAAGSAHEWQPNTGMCLLAGKERTTLSVARHGRHDGGEMEQEFGGLGPCAWCVLLMASCARTWNSPPPRLDVRARPTMVPVAAMMARSSRAERPLNQTDNEVVRHTLKKMGGRRGDSDGEATGLRRVLVGRGRGRRG